MIRHLILFVFLIADLCAGSLKVVLVGDTDSNLTDQIEKDIELLTLESRTLSHHLGRPLELYVIKGKEVYRDNVRYQLQALEVERDDILIVFYSGHGFRDNYKKSPFPYMFFTRTQEAFDMNEMVNIVCDKKAQFALLMVDACNLPMAHMDEPESKDIYDNFVTRGDIRCNLRGLFENGRGVLAIASCSPGEVAWASRAGGYFTQAFLDSIYTGDSSTCVDWKVFAKTLKAKTGDVQHPVYHFYP